MKVKLSFEVLFYLVFTIRWLFFVTNYMWLSIWIFSSETCYYLQKLVPFARRLPLIWWKTIFDGRQPLMEDDLWWKMPFDGRRPLMEDGLWWKTILPLSPRYRRCGDFFFFQFFSLSQSLLIDPKAAWIKKTYLAKVDIKWLITRNDWIVPIFQILR